MGMRFRKSINFGGSRINISKSGVGGSVGGKGFRYTKKANGGTRTTTSIPGTGLSYQKDKGKAKSRKAASADITDISNKTTSVVLKVTGVITLIPATLLLFAVPPIGLVAVGAGIGQLVLSKRFKKKGENE